MNRSTLLHRLLLCFTLTMFSGASTFSATQSPPQKPPLDLRQHPTNGKTPIQVSLGLYITNFVAIDETRESFEVAGYLTGKWQDPRLILPAGSVNPSNPQQPPRTFRIDELWTPPIEAANSINHKTNAYSMEVDRAGIVTYTERFDAILILQLRLAKISLWLANPQL